MSAVRTRGGGGATGDLECLDCGEEEGTSGNNSAASVTRGRLLANLIEMASRGARTIVDNLDDKKALSIRGLHHFFCYAQPRFRRVRQGSSICGFGGAFRDG